MSYVPYANSQTMWPYRPGAVTTFYVYCGLMILIYLLVAAMGAFFLMMAAEIAAEDPEMSEAEARIFGTIFLAMGGVLAVMFAIPPFLPRRKWAWIVGIVAISFGLTSCCFWPLCIPLLIYYVQEPTRRWYGLEPPMPPMMYGYGPPPGMPYPPPQPPYAPPQPPQAPQDPRWGGPG
jgi:hypothetical protein